jgi:2-C-methyl-D-erythritol 4-phosphate cytidylyltransferase
MKRCENHSSLTAFTTVCRIRPKQFIELLGKPVLLHSLEIFSTLPGVTR